MQLLNVKYTWRMRFLVACASFNRLQVGAHASRAVGYSFNMSSGHTFKSEETINFIEDYRKFPLLWDSKHKYYVNKIKRNKILKVLGTKYNMTTEDVKKKIKCLRSYYCKEKTRILNKKRDADTDETYQSSWFAYNNLSFLSVKTAPPRKKKNSTENDDNQNDSDISQYVSAQFEEPKSLSTTNSTQSVPQPISTKRNTKPSSKEINRDEETYNFMKTASEMIVDRNECDLFGLMVATKLKKFNHRSCAIMQNYINNYIFKMELQELDNTCLPAATVSSQNTPEHEISANLENTQKANVKLGELDKIKVLVIKKNK